MRRGSTGSCYPDRRPAAEAWLAELVAELDPDGRPAGFELAGEALRVRVLPGAAAPLALVELA